MALSRSDVSVDICRSCVSSSAATLPSVCPKATQAFAFSENCLIYFTDTPSFHVLTDEPFNAIRFNGNITNAPTFNSSLTTLMTTLMNKASLGNSEIKFATGMTKLNSNTSLYGLVQCSPDLSRRSCTECVQYLISQAFPNSFVTFTNKTLFMAMGGRVVVPSCNVRYELYPFYKNVTYDPTSPASHRNSTSAPTAVKSSKSRKIIAIVVPIAGLLVLLIFIASVCILLRKKKQRKFSDNFNKEEMDTLESLQFSIGTIKLATQNFSDGNQLGKGGQACFYRKKSNAGAQVCADSFFWARSYSGGFCPAAVVQGSGRLVAANNLLWWFFYRFFLF